MNEQAEQPKEEKPYERKGHLLFYKFCDMRIAVVGMNIFNVVLIVLSGLVGIWKFGFGSILVMFPGLVLSGVGIYGALNFELWAVLLATVGFVLGLLSDIWYLNWIGLVIGCLICYPHIVLCHELNEGIISKETYEKEEYICDEAKEYVEEYVQI